MIPRLFKPNDTNFTTLGFGALSGTVECNVVEQINGVYELNMQIFTDGPNFKNISIGSIIAAKPNLTTENQAFVVESMSKPIDNIVTIYATHISQHRAKLIPVSVFSATSLTTALSGAISNSLETNPFNLHSSRTSSADYEIVTPRSFREVLGGSEGSLLDVYGGEYIFNNFDIELVSKRGRDQGIQVVYGQNMTDFNMDEEFSWNGTATGVYPYWYSEQDGLVVGDIQYSPVVNLTGYQRTVTVDFTDKFEAKPTKAELEAEALSYIQNRGLNSVNIKVAFNQFEEHIRGDVLKMNLGDTVHIINSAYGVNLTSRIVSLDFNVLSENYNTIEIGELQTTINEAISDTVPQSTSQGGGTDTDFFVQKGTEIPDSSDLDDYKTVGEYYSANPSSLSNCPVTGGNIFIKVMETPLGLQQWLYTTSNIYTYARRYTTSSDTWAAWYRNNMKSQSTDTMALGTTVLTGDLDLSAITWTGLTRPFFRRPIPDSNDLNDCLETGLYYVGTGSGSGATANIPVAYSGYCLTFNATTNYTLQFYTRLGSTNRVLYMRKYSSGTWASWGSITFTAI